MTKKKMLKCYISSSFNIDITKIENLLLKNDIESSYQLSNEINYQVSLQKQIQDIIEKVDFLIAILQKNSLNTIYEIGLAHGMNKPVFIIIPDNSDLPFLIKDSFYLRTSIDNIFAIQNALNPFIKSILKKSKKKSITKVQPKILEININELVEKIEEIRRNGNEHTLITILEKVFLDIDANTIKVEDKKDFHIDMSLWLDELENITGNPSVIEIKYGTLNEKRLKLAEDQLSKYIDKSNAKLGFLLYLDKTGKRFPKKSMRYPNIIRFEVSDLINELSKMPFVDIIRYYRNAIAHGKDV